VTDSSHLCTHGYGMGVAVGDVDNDGFADVFVTHFGAPNQLFRNNGNGTFTDITQKAGVAGSGKWGSSATFFDYDRDGHLDLFVANYVDFSLEKNQKCFASTSVRDYCAPSGYPHVPGILYHNRGDGTFADFDGNGTEDIFLTHLTREKSTLFFNRGEGYFDDRSVEVGVAAPSIPFTGFGTVFLDYDNDGWLDIVAANGAVHLIEALRQKA